jgi:hypothetical protein
MTGFSNGLEDRCRGMIATGMPGCMPQSDHETVAAAKDSFTGQYLKPLLERASVKPTVVEVAPKRVKRTRKASAADEDELGLVAAK